MKNTKDTPNSDVRVVRTVSVPAPLDRWVTDLLGAGDKRGKFSTLVQRLLAALMEGKIPKSALEGDDLNSTTARAADYLSAKAASMQFEEDVALILDKWIASLPGKEKKPKVVRNRRHTLGTPFVADFSIEKGDTIIATVSCKSSPREERLQLALGEAVIGKQVTGKPVITVVPYFLTREGRGQASFLMLDLPLVGVTELRETLDKLAKDF